MPNTNEGGEMCLIYTITQKQRTCGHMDSKDKNLLFMLNEFSIGKARNT